MANSDQLIQADALLERGRVLEARQILTLALIETPDDPELLTCMGRASLIDENTNDALDQFNAALAAQPGHQLARYYKAAVLCDLADYPAAESLLVDLIREDPTDADFLALYSRVMLLSLEIDKAGLLAEEAIRHEPNSPNALRATAIFSIVSGDQQKRSASLSELLENYPEDQGVLRLLFFSLVEAGKHREALALGQELLTADPSDEQLLDALIELRALTHPASWPVYPLVRWGWGGSAAMWVAFILLHPVLESHAPDFHGPFVLGYLALVVYSWTYQPLLTRWIRHRGIH